MYFKVAKRLDFIFKKYICVFTHTHTHMLEYYSAITKNEIMPFAATWRDLEIIVLSEVSQKEKDIYHICAI